MLRVSRLTSALRLAPAAVRLRSTQPIVSHDVLSRNRIELSDAIGAEAQPHGLTRNPNMSVIGPAVASELANRRLGDPSLFGVRETSWWTGKAPHEVAGWVATAAGDGHLTSLPQLNLSAECTREQVMDYFDNTWALTDQLFASLQGEATFYLQPYHQLREWTAHVSAQWHIAHPCVMRRIMSTCVLGAHPCAREALSCSDRWVGVRLASHHASARPDACAGHPLIFYYGHVAALYVNKLRLAGLIDRPIDAYLEVLFETGVDEMSWDDLSQSATQWPAVSEVIAYRRKVYETVRDIISTHEGLGYGHQPILESSPLWALAMSFEHERIHLETSTVLMRELPHSLVRAPEGWAPLHPSVPCTDVFTPTPAVDYPVNEMVRVEAGKVQLGKPRDEPSFGWDNEYGAASRAVDAFDASQFKISNGEFLEFVRAGGYREQRFWGGDGWGWRTFRNAKWPTFWCSVGPSNLHQYRLRTVHDIVPMPWSWPAEVNAHEAMAYCNWRTEQADDPSRSYRLVTEGEHMRIREACGPAPASVLSDSGADLASKGVNLNLAHGSPSPVDAESQRALAAGETPPPFGDPMGNVWEWCADDFHPLDGFKVHPLYDECA